MNITLKLVSPEDLQVLVPLLKRLQISYEIKEKTASSKGKLPNGVRLTDQELKERLEYLAEGRADRSLPDR